MNKKERKEFEALTKRLVKQKKATLSWWVQKPSKKQISMGLKEMRNTAKETLQGGSK